MSTPLNKTTENANWKEKYLQSLNEFEEKQRVWSEEQSKLYKSILRLVFSFTGQDEKLDKQLAEMRDKLRKETAHVARNKIISPVLDDVIRHAQQNDDSEQKNPLACLHYLLDSLKLPATYQPQLRDLGKALDSDGSGKALYACIDQLSQLVSEACKTGAGEARIQLKSDDPLTQLLENLSLPGELGIEVMSLRKRASEIEEDQERLQLIQELVQILSRHNKDEGLNKGSDNNFPHLRETLLELFEWLSIPQEYKTRVEFVKTQISKLQAEADLSVVLRDTAIVINDLQEALQVELGDIQNFLIRVTDRLEDVEACFRDLASSEMETTRDSKQLNKHIQSSVQHIRQGIAEGQDLKSMKQAIESRLSFIEKSAEDFLNSSQSRRQQWQGKVDNLKQRLEGMKGETVKLHKRIQEEYKRAKTDALTGVPNRLAYNEKIKQEFARWQRHDRPFCVCVIDVDKFKAVNDTYGHKAGDKVLKTIAEVCASKIRKLDFFARYGGEEFVLILPETRLEQSRVVAENLRREVETCKFHYSKKPVVINISCGLAEFGENDTPERVFERADKALYKAKKNGRNQVVG